MRASPRIRRRFGRLAPLIALLAAGAGLARAEDPAARGAAEKADGKPGTPPITVEAILVEPADPGPETLCKLRVILKNRTDREVSGLGFRVAVNGTDLPVYENQRYMEAIEPGETVELALYNFWSSETSRPPRPDGALKVEVSLVEARYLKRTMEEDVPVWTLLGEVPGLPSSAAAKRPFKNEAR